VTDDEFRVVVYEHFSRFVQCLEDYRDQLQGERDSTQGNEGLHRLIDLQLRRVDRLITYLDGEADETLRDLVDRGHVLEQARQGKFV
jgi:hypothetical protein